MYKRIATALVLTGAATMAIAHGDEADSHATKIDYANTEVHAFGKAADPDKAAHTVKVGMSDAMRFDPESIEVKAGEVVRFDAHNNGDIMHEMVLGTPESLAEHAEMMKKFPGMEHDEPYMAHVAPGKSVTLGWVFPEPGEYHFACLVPGHYDAGMRGKVTVR